MVGQHIMQRGAQLAAAWRVAAGIWRVAIRHWTVLLLVFFISMVGTIIYGTIFQWGALTVTTFGIPSIIGRFAHDYEEEPFLKLEDTLTYCNIFNLGNRSSPICGIPFSPSWIPYLDRLGLSVQKISKMTKQDDHRILRKDPTFVTAFDDSHFGTAMDAQMKSFAEFYPSRKIIVYDLGLSLENIEKLLDMPMVEAIRPFNFSAYPSHVRRLSEYRWKPLLLAEVSQEFDAVFYADAHIIWQKEGNLTDLLEKVHCQVYGCDYYSSLLMGHTWHSIYATTHPRLYEYFPMEAAVAKRIEMREAGFQLIYYTRDARWNVHKWYVLCALEKGCMGPKRATLTCKFTDNRMDDYARCHRYDQSVINMLLATRHAYNQSRYFVPFAHTRT